MYASQDVAPDSAQELSSPAHILSEEYHADTYEDSNASFDETKFSVPEFDSSPFRSSVTQYSDAFSHKGQDLEELSAIPSTLFDSPTSKDKAETVPESRVALKRTHSDRLSSGTSLTTKSPKIWQESSPALPAFYTNRINTRPAYSKPIVEKDGFWGSKALSEHNNETTLFSSTKHYHNTSSNEFEQTQETKKSLKLFEYPFTEPLGSYVKNKTVRESILNTPPDSYFEKWASIPSRYLHVMNLPKTIGTWILKEIFEKFGDIQGILAKNLRNDGSVIVSFYDVRDCIKIQKQLRHYRFFNDRYLEAQFCSKTALIAMSKGGTMLPFLCENEGEILVSLQGSSDISKNVLFNLLSSYGDIRMIKSPPATIKKAIICEYFDIRDAMLAVDELNGRVIQDNKLHVTFYESGFISWKIVSNELKNLQDENVILDQFKSLNIYEKRLNNNANEYIPNHYELTNTVSHSKLLSPSFLSNKSFNGSITDKSHAITSFSFQDEKSSYTSQTPNESNGINCYKRNIQKLNNIQTNGNTCSYLSDKFTNLHNYVHSPTIKETFDEETKSKSFNPTFIAGSAPSLRRIYSANMKRNITHDGIWTGHSSPITENLSFNLKYPSFDILKTTSSNSGTNLIAEKNKVDYDRITRGLDMRTTIMIKNIPNKFTQQMLQEYIDATNSKTYDFLYLRIDFRNRCNVGYAFVNFIDPISIVTFGQARVGTKWNRFHSDKICDISYANIQGKECLIEKFRNSCVMDEDPSYRPKIFISHGPATGEEQEFPAPNNPRRKLRSIVSAQQIGLFPPAGSRAPWSTREEQGFI